MYCQCGFTLHYSWHKLAMGSKMIYLPEYEVFSDDVLHCIITPYIPVQALTSKILNVLNVDH